MSQFSFVTGERIRLKNEMYHLHRKLGAGKWQLEKDTNGQYVIMEESELRDLYFQNFMSFVSTYMANQVEDDVVECKIAKNFSDYPENIQLIASQRIKYVNAIVGVGGKAKKELTAVSKELGIVDQPDISTVRRWSKRLRYSRNNICSLIPNFKKRGNRNPRFPEEVIEIALVKIREIYLKDAKNSEEETISAIRDEVTKENISRSDNNKLPIPQRKFLRKMLDEIDAYEVTRARHGKAAATKEFREANFSGEIISDPLERVEIDHTVLDLIVVDRNTYLPLGRPTITIAIDRCTRAVCGYHISYDPPSYVSIMKCLAHAIKPKDYVLGKYPAIENKWNCWGIPTLVVVDNAMEFHSKDLDAATLSLLIDIRYCPVGQPWWKGAVERFFRTMGKSLIHRVPGTTFSSAQDKGDYNSLKSAAITEDDLNELLHTWIIDVYHQTVNRSTLRTPNSLWTERIASVHQSLPASAELLDVSLFSIEHRTVFHYGVTLNNLNYSSKELTNLRKRNGQMKVELRWDRSNLGYIHVLDVHSNTYLKVPCTWFGYANGLSLWLHMAIRAEALSHEGPESQEKLDAAKARIRAIYEKALANKKIVTRKTAARAMPSLTSTVSGLQSQLRSDDRQNIFEDRESSELENRNKQKEDIPDYESH